MPGFDGSGPSGGGPLTGWGRGFCAQPLSRAEGFAPRVGRGGVRQFGRPRFGFGFGPGRGLGRGRGRGRGWW